MHGRSDRPHEDSLCRAERIASRAGVFVRADRLRRFATCPRSARCVSARRGAGMYGSGRMRGNAHLQRHARALWRMRVWRCRASASRCRPRSGARNEVRRRRGLPSRRVLSRSGQRVVVRRRGAGWHVRGGLQRRRGSLRALRRGRVRRDEHRLHRRGCAHRAVLRGLSTWRGQRRQVPCS